MLQVMGQERRRHSQGITRYICTAGGSILSCLPLLFGRFSTNNKTMEKFWRFHYRRSLEVLYSSSVYSSLHTVCSFDMLVHFFFWF